MIQKPGRMERGHVEEMSEAPEMGMPWHYRGKERGKKGGKGSGVFYAANAKVNVSYLVLVLCWLPGAS